MESILIAITAMSVVAAAIAAAVAWRVVRDERRRSAARVAVLAADIHHDFGRGSAPPDAPIASELFARPDSTASTGPRYAAVVGLGMLVVGAAAVVAIMLGHQSPVDGGGSARGANSRHGAAGPPVAVASAADRAPLELVALGHDRDGDRLTVRGVVKNPQAASPVDGLAAVVFLFDRTGGFIGSGRAPVAPSALAPGGSASFLVTVAGAQDVSRYRVSFRTDERIVPHVDRRDHGAVAQLQ